MTQNIFEQFQKIPHSFHIPVMGTAFTIDTPIRVAKYGISSVISIGDDELCEVMRKHYAQQYNLDYELIPKFSDNYRARRITAYLNLVNEILSQQINELKSASFEDSEELNKYFDLLPDSHPLATDYQRMLTLTDPQEKTALQDRLKRAITPGFIDVNIMTKLDRNNYSQTGDLLPQEFSDALSALRGFAESDLCANVVFSAGFNRRLYAYCTEFDDFFPDEFGRVKKGIILKVSDFRSSEIQGRFLAKKGLWVVEHRIESGLNCGGHAFATTGYLIGPILQEFKDGSATLFQSLYETCNKSLRAENRIPFPKQAASRVTMQGGIGNADEQSFLMTRYNVEGTGWASPFLLVPEATTLDMETRELLAKSKAKDFYLSKISPLGVPFNTVKGTMSEAQKLERAEAGRPGSPCPKGHLVSNMEFSKKPVCTAAVFYQKRKINEAKEGQANGQLNEDDYENAYQRVIDKACLCEDLAAGAFIEFGLENPEGKARPKKTAVCPGPNLANFSKLYSLKEMVSHIYGKVNLLKNIPRPHFFISECKMYIRFIEEEIQKAMPQPSEKDIAYLQDFRNNLLDGIDYYQSLFSEFSGEIKEQILSELDAAKAELDQVLAKHQSIFADLSVA